MPEGRITLGYFYQFALVKQTVMRQSSLPVWPIVIMLLFSGCGGNLTDEQRRQMREKMEMNKIMRVTDVEITEGALSKGRSLVSVLENFNSDSVKIDSFLSSEKGRIRFIRPEASDIRGLERQLVDAYVASESGSLQDNVQAKRDSKGEYDSLLYTKPVTTNVEDGGEQLLGIWRIWLPKKEIILDLTRKN